MFAAVASLSFSSIDPLPGRMSDLSVIWQKENGDDPEANGEGEGSGEHERTKYDYRWYVPLNPEAQSEQEDELPFDCRPASPIAKMFGITLANPAGNANSATFNDHWVRGWVRRYVHSVSILFCRH